LTLPEKESEPVAHKRRATTKNPEKDQCVACRYGNTREKLQIHVVCREAWRVGEKWVPKMEAIEMVTTVRTLNPTMWFKI
jgi:hypothetical protein